MINIKLGAYFTSEEGNLFQIIEVYYYGVIFQIIGMDYEYCFFVTYTELANDIINKKYSYINPLRN